MTSGSLTIAVRCCAAVLLAAMLCACGRKTGTDVRPEAPPRPVSMAIADWQPMEKLVTVTGTLAAQEKSVLSAKVTGRIGRLMVDIGSLVQNGDVLAELEQRDYELGVQQAAAALAQARAGVGLPPEGTNDVIEVQEVSGVKQARAVLQEASQNRDRVRRLFLSGIAAQSEMDTVEAAFTVAQTRFEAAQEEALTRIANVAQRRAEYDLANKRLSDTTLRAPFEGVVQSRLASLGQYVAAGTPIVELVQADPLRFRLSVPEIYSGMVQAGQYVRLRVQGDERSYAGTITRVSPALDEGSRMLLVEADVPRQGTLRPGLFARAQIVVNTNERGLSIPADALTTFAGIEKVVVVAEGKAVEKVVSTGRRGPGWVEILSGLKQGEGVVLTPEGLRTGNPVIVREASAPQPSAGAGGEIHS